MHILLIMLSFFVKTIAPRIAFLKRIPNGFKCKVQNTQKKSPERSSNLSGEAVTQSVEKLEIRLGGKRTVDSPFIFMHPASDAFN